MSARPITPADWKLIEESLSGRYGSEKLLCDGYELTISREQEKNRLVLVVYVNGVWKSEWLQKDCEERRRFLRPTVFRLFPKAKVEKILKGLGQRSRAKFIAEHGLDKTHVSYWLAWNSFTALRRHLVKNNKEILVQCPETWVVVSGAGRTNQAVVFETENWLEANAYSLGVHGSHGDVMKRLPDGTLTTEF